MLCISIYILIGFLLIIHIYRYRSNKKKRSLLINKSKSIRNKSYLCISTIYNKETQFSLREVFKLCVVNIFRQSLTFETKCLQKLNHITIVYENGMFCVSCKIQRHLKLYQLLCMIWIANMHNVETGYT